MPLRTIDLAKFMPCRRRREIPFKLLNLIDFDRPDFGRRRVGIGDDPDISGSSQSFGGAFRVRGVG